MARIFIVDDDPDVVEACTLILESEGHSITPAYNRDEGMNLLKADTPDLLILDVMMEQPDDGIAMAQELRRINFNKPILMLTSIGKTTGYSFGRDNEILPVDAFEEKPLDPKKLITLVNQLLAR
ncbi:response regulator [bacterium]|nr:response regulator [candidate division CSSED10-310 bacterium]